MLTKEEALFKVDAGRVFPDRLKQKKHAHYLALAEAMFRVYEEGVGKTRSELHRAVEALFHQEKALPPKRVKAFCKLLDDVSDYEEAKSGKVGGFAD